MRGKAVELKVFSLSFFFLLIFIHFLFTDCNNRYSISVSGSFDPSLSPSDSVQGWKSHRHLLFLEF